jgi:hypothetical protein
MRPLLLRSLMALALAVSLAVRHQTSKDDTHAVQAFDMRKAVRALTHAHGWMEQAPLAPPRPSLANILYFMVPDCSRAAIVVPVTFNLEIVSLISRVVAPDYHTRILYIEYASPERSRFALYAEWLKHRALSLAGWTPYLPIRSAVMIAEPPGCHASQDIDWRQIWQRERA